MSIFEITINPIILEKAKNFFNSSLTDILNELLQNARRAEATKVVIEPSSFDEGKYLIITDDGKGIFCDGVVIALGGSFWKDEIQDNENPAGCGLFSLANRGCTIESCRQKVSLSPEAFGGGVPIEIQSTDFDKGTKITFPLTEREIGANSLSSYINPVVKYFPLPVVYKGRKLERKNFLEGSLFEREWNGLRIGVFREQYYKTETLNFYGVTVCSDLAREITGKEEGYFNRYHLAKVDVLGGSGLELVLPARKEIVKNDFLAQLKEECLRTIFEYLSTQEYHRLPYLSWSKAISLGVNLPEAEAKLYKFNRDLADYNRDNEDWELIDVTDECYIFDLKNGSEADKQQLFAYAWDQSGKGVLLEDDADYAGYSWYNQIPKIVEFTVSVTADGVTNPLEDCEDLEEYRPDSITISYVVEDEEGSRQVHQLETDVAFRSTTIDGVWYGSESILLLVTGESKVGQEQLLKVLTDAYFCPGDCADQVSYDTQLEAFEVEVRHLINTILLGNDLAELEKIKDLAERYLLWEAPGGKETQITITEDRQIIVETV